MKIGTKSLLIGAHWPPHILMVILAWKWLYGTWPTWREFLAICIHDIGYIGVVEMDGPDGTMHPERGARIADTCLGAEYGALIRGHSKGYAEAVGVPLSKLYGPDKLSHALGSPVRSASTVLRRTAALRVTMIRQCQTTNGSGSYAPGWPREAFRRCSTPLENSVSTGGDDQYGTSSKLPRRTVP